MKQSEEKIVLVYADWYMFNAPRLIGKLHFSTLRGKAVYSFEYDQSWLKTGISIDPGLPLFSGIHYASAMTLLNRTDGNDADDGVSYLELVRFIKSECADVSANLEELFRRVLFSVCVSNTDDHLRNHGFLYTESGWSLSPAFDINPNETGTGLKLNIDEHDNSLDVDLVMSTSPYYLITSSRAVEIKNEVINAVSGWRKVAAKYKTSSLDIELKSGAFRI